MRGFPPHSKRYNSARLESRELVGKDLNQYRIVSLIGLGGMGAVYRAQDAHLDRPVAIKVLPERVTSDPERVRRFTAEARAASALNHPNIVAIYDVGEASVDGSTVRFIAMELIDGVTVRDSIDRDPLPLKKTLTLLAQVADTLAAAHDAGVVHRDLKPDNIMITRGGYAKVLDFGLAKLRERGNVESTASQATALKGTDAGTVLGTVGYMSPEQAQGKPVDHRSDVFSFGCILYETVTRRRPFSGDSNVDTLHKIIYSNPEPVAKLTPSAPPQLQWIIRKCLAKDPDERYHSMKDVALDLRELAKDLESGSTAAYTAAVRSPGRWWMAAAAGIVLLLLIAAIVLTARRGIPGATATAPRLEIQRLTSFGNVVDAAISPDGKYVSYVIADQGRQALWLQQIGTSQAIEIRPAEQIAYWGHRFSPDGSFIYYGAKTRDETRGKLYRIASLGGAPVEILTGIDSVITFSPDGTKIAYLRENYPTTAESSLMVAKVDGSGAKPVETRRDPEFYVPVFFGGPSWSPDGQWIAVAKHRTRGEPRTEIIGVRPDGSQTRLISNHPWTNAAQVTWLPDGSGLLAVANDRPGTARSGQVWFLPFPSGEPQRITRDLLDYRIVSLTRDGRSLVTVPTDAESAVWLVPMSGDGRPARLTTSKYDGIVGAAMAPDGRIVFVAVDTGRSDLWIANRDGSARRPLLTQNQPNRHPAISPSGDVAFITTEPSGTFVAAARLDGSGYRRLAPAVGGSTPAFTPEGRTIVFTGSSQGETVLFSVPLGGGVAVRLTDYLSFSPSISPDGKRIAAICQIVQGEPAEICILPIEGGKPEQRFPLSYYNGSNVTWTPDGRGVLFTGMLGDRMNVFLQPLDGSAPRPVTKFEDQVIFGFSRNPDGKSLVVARGRLSRDAVLMSGFR